MYVYCVYDGIYGGVWETTLLTLIAGNLLSHNLPFVGMRGKKYSYWICQKWITLMLIILEYIYLKNKEFKEQQTIIDFFPSKPFTATYVSLPAAAVDRSASMIYECLWMLAFINLVYVLTGQYFWYFRVYYLCKFQTMLFWCLKLYAILSSKPITLPSRNKPMYMNECLYFCMFVYVLCTYFPARRSLFYLYYMMIWPWL